MLNYILSALLLLTSIGSFGAEFIAGKDYEIISSPPHATGKKIRVTEFFSFGCPWCYRLEPTLNQWIDQHHAQITFKKVPVIFNKDWEYYAKAYYAAKALSLSTTFNPLLFKHILDEKRPLNSNATMIDFFIQHGVAAKTAQSAFESSPSIDMAVNNSKRLMQQYHIAAVPAVIVNDHFKTDLQMAKTTERLAQILDFLLSESRY